MASIADSDTKPDDTNTQIKDLPVNQCPSVRHLEDIDGKISDRREQIELCNMILNDLLEIQKIVAERGLENTSCGEPDN